MTKPPARPHQPAGWKVTKADRAALLRKYRALATWRRIRDGGGDAQAPDARGPERADLQAVSREFPGALRELDLLGIAEITRRITWLAGPGAEARDPPWVAWILAFHGLMRAALTTKRAAGRARRIAASALPAAVEAAINAAGVTVDEAFVRAAAHPPGGRLAVVVLHELAARFAVPATEISLTLFPARRPPPYRLSS